MKILKNNEYVDAAFIPVVETNEQIAARRAELYAQFVHPLTAAFVNYRDVDNDPEKAEAMRLKIIEMIERIRTENPYNA
jgi:hypothetical protein